MLTFMDHARCRTPATRDGGCNLHEVPHAGDDAQGNSILPHLQVCAPTARNSPSTLLNNKLNPAGLFVF